MADVTTIRGAVLCGCDGRPFAGYGGGIQLHTDPAVAARVARAWNQDASFPAVSKPFAAVLAEISLGERVKA